MAAFVLFLALASLVRKPAGSLWLSSPEFWVYPLQTLVCGGLLIWGWSTYGPFRRNGLGFALLVGAVVFLLWIAPQQFFHLAPRISGFNPERLAEQPALYWTTVCLRLARLVVVVPLVEEIFWRGFLLRYLISEDFEKVPFGTFTPASFAVVTVAFALSHAIPDWPAALITGALYNFIAYRTKNLAACVAAHALTNLALGLWILATRQWGFW